MKQAILLIMTLLLLGGCSQDASLTPETSGSGQATPLQVDDTVLEKSVETRAATSLATDGATIGIFCSKETGYDAAQNNIPYIYNAATSKWAPKEASKPVWLLAGNANVCAYYPYNAAYTDNTAIPLATAVYTAAGDICFAPNRVMNGTPTKSKTLFAMQRAMAMMKFTLKKGDYPGTCKVTGITLKNTNLPATGTINITAGTNTAATVTKADFSYTPVAATGGADGSVVPTAAGVKAQEVLLVPFTLSDSLAVELTVDSKLMTLKLAPTAFTDSKIEAGKRYLLTLKLNGTALNVTNVTIEDWVDFAMTDTGDKDYEPFPKQLPPHAIEVEGLDFYVADGNVRAIKQVDNTYKYDFAEEQGYYSSNGSGGDYFCWNTIDPTATSTSNTTDVWDTNSDPCRKIGDGQWYTPTQAQLQKLKDLYTGSKAVWGTFTMNDNTIVNGMYFGTATAPTTKGDQDKYVFLPAAGLHDGGSYSFIGTNGIYWSSTFDTSNSGKASHLSFYNGYCSVDSSLRNRGFPLRCSRDK